MKNKVNCKFIRVYTVILACLFLLAGCNTAQNKDAGEGWKPTAPVNMIVSYAAGGGTDIFARAAAQYIDLDGQTIHVTNIEGGGGTIGAMEAYHSDNDGLTLYTHSIETLAGTYYGGTLPENLCEEMIWVACLADEPSMISVAADSPYKSVEDLIAAASADPNSISIAGVISIPSAKGVILAMQQSLGIDITIVPYDSAAKARAAVLGGHDDLLFGQLSDIKAYVDSGELRVLAVTSEERNVLIPDVPTFKELGYDGIIYGSTRCFLLPPETDEEIARYYETKFKEVYENEEFQSVARDTVGVSVSFTSMDDLRDKIPATMKRMEDYTRLATE